MATDVIAAFAMHQRSAPLDARERLLEHVASWRGLRDRFVLATCHRVEIYAVTEGLEARDWLARELPQMLDPRLGNGLSCFVGAGAARHLFEVASGLDSAVQGETQIRSQVRAVLARAALLDPRLRRLLERALHLARRLRRESGLGRVSRSVGSLAVDEVIGLLPDPSRASVLVIGAGEMGRLAVRALSRRVGTVLVANRDRDRADLLARSVGAVAIGLDAVLGILGDVDGIVSAADTRGALLTAGALARRLALRSLAVVDIAVPRSIDAETRSLAGLVYRSVDDLTGMQTLSSAELERTRDACAAEAARFDREISERLAADAIRDVRAVADVMRRRELERALRRLGHLPERDRRVVEALTARVVNSLLHGPTMALKEEPARREHALALFGIGHRPP